MTTPNPPTNDDATAAFLRERPRLLRLAYATVGTVSEAEDVLQEAWLRAERTDWSQVREPAAWLTTVVSRLALDVVTSARVRREAYVGPWLPEPIVESDLAGDAAQAEQVSVALLVVMEEMAPAERAAFVLHDVFGMPFAEVAQTLDRTPEAVRALASRGRRRAREQGAAMRVDPAEQRAVVEAFVAAVASGELDEIVRLLAPEIVLRNDGGGIVNAARYPIHGADRIARVMIALAHRRNVAIATAGLIRVNGLTGVLTNADGDISVMAFDVADGRITAIDVVRNPEKLSRLP